MSKKIENLSGWHPAGQAVLLRAFELEDTRKASEKRIVVPDEVAMSSSTCDTMGIVVEIGPDAWKGTVGGGMHSVPETPRAEVGDRVAFTKFSGGVIKGRDGFIYRMIHCNSIYMVMDQDLEESSRAVA